MNIQDALKMLIEAVNLAQSRGAYNLKESATILPAVETFTNNQNKPMNEENQNQGAVVETNPEVTETPVQTEAPVQESPAVDEGPVEDAGEADLAPSEQSA